MECGLLRGSPVASSSPPSVPTSPSRTRSRRTVGRGSRREAGFTILELMIVVILVGISAAVVGPTLMGTMSINRTNRCMQDIARLMRRARADAIGTGRAHLVDMPATGTERTFSVYRGDSSSCTRSAWGGIVGTDTPVDVVGTAEYAGGSFGVMTQITGPGGAPTRVCFEPDGDRFTGTTSLTVDAAELIITVLRTQSGANVGDPRRAILIPQFAAPRVFR